MNIKLLDYKELKDFSPGAGIESFDEHLYVVGEDARFILVLNRSWKVQESINLFASDTFRMTKEAMSGIEATTIIEINKIPFILMIGSGAMHTNTNKAVLMNLHTRAIEEFDLSEYYDRLKTSGFDELDIKGVTVLNDKLILFNKANKTSTDNKIIITSLDFWKKQDQADILTVKLELEEKAGKCFSLSGLTYSYNNDWFVMTILSENTNKSADDNPPVESYVGVVENASRKIGRHRFKINEYFNLTEIDKKFKGHKVKSICIQTDKDQKLKLHLVSGNNKGEDFLFKLRLKE